MQTHRSSPQRSETSYKMHSSSHGRTPRCRSRPARRQIAWSSKWPTNAGGWSAATARGCFARSSSAAKTARDSGSACRSVAEESRQMAGYFGSAISQVPAASSPLICHGSRRHQCDDQLRGLDVAPRRPRRRGARSPERSVSTTVRASSRPRDTSARSTVMYPAFRMIVQMSGVARNSRMATTRTPPGSTERRLSSSAPVAQLDPCWAKPGPHSLKGMQLGEVPGSSFLSARFVRSC